MAFLYIEIKFRHGGVRFFRGEGTFYYAQGQRGWRHFSRMFREVMGTSAIDYVKRLRIEEAKRRLIRSGCSVADVASEVGFENIPYFHRVFKEVEGISPRAYRKKGLGT